MVPSRCPRHDIAPLYPEYPIMRYYNCTCGKDKDLGIVDEVLLDRMLKQYEEAGNKADGNGTP